MVYKSQAFEEVFQKMEQILVELEAFLGPFPYPRLLVIETEELEKPRSPGVIAVNSPRQASMQQLQIEYSNWLQWQLVFSLTQQWYGTSIQATSWQSIGLFGQHPSTWLWQ